MFPSALNQSSVVGHLGGFQGFPITNRAAINIYLQIAYISFSVVFIVFPEGGLLGQRLETILWFLLQGVRLFYRKTTNV